MNVTHQIDTRCKPFLYYWAFLRVSCISGGRRPVLPGVWIMNISHAVSRRKMEASGSASVSSSAPSPGARYRVVLGRPECTISLSPQASHVIADFCLVRSWQDKCGPKFGKFYIKVMEGFKPPYSFPIAEGLKEVVRHRTASCTKTVVLNYDDNIGVLTIYFHPLTSSILTSIRLRPSPNFSETLAVVGTLMVVFAHSTLLFQFQAAGTFLKY